MTAAVIALVLYVGGLVLAFGARSFAHHRRTGDWGFRLGGASSTGAERWAKALFAAALVAGLAGPVLAVAEIGRIAALDLPVLHVAGFVLAVAGIAGTLYSQAQMGASWRVGVDPAERTGLVTTGVFGAVRNPVFTAMVTSSLGITLLTANAFALVATVLLVAAVELQVRVVEEPYLLRTHPGAYPAYAAQVGRFLPGIGTIRTTPIAGEVA